jgi:predicted TIM-barrel fold metal-dependent hydrolase
MRNIEIMAHPSLVHIAINHYRRQHKQRSVTRPQSLTDPIVRSTHRFKRFISLTPPRGEVAKQDLERKVNQHGQREILLLQSLFEQLETRRSVVGRRTELGHEVNDDEGLNVWMAVRQLGAKEG